MLVARIDGGANEIMREVMMRAMDLKGDRGMVVIYGGGIAGAVLARQLSGDCEVTLVDPNDYFEIPMATPRSLVTPGFADQSIIAFSTALPSVKVVRASLLELDASGGLAQTHDGQQMFLSGDVTVLATGSRFANALMRANGVTAGERKAFYARYQKQLAQAGRVLIVGGGPIGVEVAGEIADNHSDKSITILEAGPRILGGTSQEAASHAASVLTRRGVTILCGECLESAGSPMTEVFAGAGEAKTSSGRVIAYDLIVWCVGGRPNTSYMTPHFASRLNDAGRIRVTPQLRVEGSETLFALGDITDLDENKMAWHVAPQVKNAVFNIRQVLAGRRADAYLKVHHPRTNNPMMAVSIGRHAGVLHLPLLGVIRSPWLNRMAKAGHMLVPKYRKILGV